jgi:hypothetical protein
MTVEEMFEVWDSPDGVARLLLDYASGSMPTPEARGAHSKVRTEIEPLLKEIKRLRNLHAKK